MIYDAGEGHISKSDSKILDNGLSGVDDDMSGVDDYQSGVDIDMSGFDGYLSGVNDHLQDLDSHMPHIWMVICGIVDDLVDVNDDL